MLPPPPWNSTKQARSSKKKKQQGEVEQPCTVSKKVIVVSENLATRAEMCNRIEALGLHCESIAGVMHY